MTRFTQFLTAMALSAGFSVAQATVITQSDPGSQHTDVNGATEVNFSDGCGYASCSGDFQIVSGSQPGLYAAPAGTADDNPYLAVPNPSQSGTAELELGETANYFGLYWGSIDRYNTISFFLTGVLIDTFSGADIAGQADGNQLASATNRFINFFFGNLRFDEVHLHSDNYAFESDNHAYATVPEPGTLALMGIALAGLMMARRRR